jgi:hypothetical protein
MLEKVQKLIFVDRNFIITDISFTLLVYSVTNLKLVNQSPRSVNVDANINDSLKSPHKIRHNLQNIKSPYRNILPEVVLRIPCGRSAA